MDEGGPGRLSPEEYQRAEGLSGPVMFTEEQLNQFLYEREHVAEEVGDTQHSEEEIAIRGNIVLIREWFKEQFQELIAANHRLRGQIDSPIIKEANGLVQECLNDYAKYSDYLARYQQGKITAEVFLAYADLKRNGFRISLKKLKELLPHPETNA